MHFFILKSFIIFLFCFLSVASGNAQLISNINFERVKTGAKDIYMYSTGHYHPVRFEGYLLRRYWISPSMYVSGKKGLGIELGAGSNCTSSSASKNRAEFTISDRQIHPQKVGQNRFYAFSMMIHEATHEIKKPVVFFQAWQNHDVSKNTRKPPLDLQIYQTEGDKYLWQVGTAGSGKLRVEARENERTYKINKRYAFEKGKWYNFVVRFQPGYKEGEGAITIWRNGKKIWSQTNNRKFSHELSNDHDEGVILNEFQVRMGAYRGRNCRGDKKVGRVIFLFDEAKIGRRYRDVAP